MSGRASDATRAGPGPRIIEKWGCETRKTSVTDDLYGKPP